jgi:hypothetical protein
MYREYELFRLGRQVVEWVFELLSKSFIYADIFPCFLGLKLADNLLKVVEKIFVHQNTFIN